MIKKLVLLIAASGFTFAGFSQSTVDNLNQHISFLASDRLEGRQTGSHGELMASEYLMTYYKKLGLQPVGDGGTFVQEFPFTPKSNPHDTLIVDPKKEKKYGHNVLAFLNNGAAQTVVIGAHYDHLGYGEYGNSLYAGAEKQIHNGADDNASGTASVLELARILQASPFKHNNYLFANFSGEELGLYGSKYLMEHLPAQVGNINYMLNMDMIGRLNAEKVLSVGGVGTSPQIKTLLQTIPAGDLKIKQTESGIGPSDHTSFYLKNIPVLFFFTGQHADYHKPTDDVEKINFDGEAQVMNLIYQIIDSLDSKGKLAFTKTKDDDNKDTPRFKVTLGIMPDYVYEGKGVRVDGVTEGKPAFKAGVKQGDIIIKLADVEVTDMQSYMKALSHCKKDEMSKLIILRNGHKKKLKATF